MGFYIVVLASFCFLVVSYVLLASNRCMPTDNWGEWLYPKSRFILWLTAKRQKMRIIGTFQIDFFHFFGFVVSFAVFVVSPILMVIDLIFGQIIYNFLGFSGIIITIFV